MSNTAVKRRPARPVHEQRKTSPLPCQLFLSPCGKKPVCRGDSPFKEDSLISQCSHQHEEPKCEQEAFPLVVMEEDGLRNKLGR